MEGNSLNFGETKTFLLHGITAAGKPLKDHLDLRGHNAAILALQDIIQEKRPITEGFIRELHKVIEEFSIKYGKIDFLKAQQLGNQILKDFMNFIKEKQNN
jgi:Fic family protein